MIRLVFTLKFEIFKIYLANYFRIVKENSKDTFFSPVIARVNNIYYWEVKKEKKTLDF